MDERWRDTYDQWKLACPYDDWDEEPSCDHEEYEVDWEGRATCNYCNHHWWLTSDQLAAYEEAEARWMAEYDRTQRREHSRFWRTVDWLRALARRLRAKKPTPTRIDDDEIPF